MRMMWPSPAVPDAIRVPPLGATLAKMIRSAQALAVADQVVVSGASFAATLFVGRSHSAALGEYSIAVSIVALVLAVQNALVLLPFTIRQHRADGEEIVDPADALALSTLLAAVATGACFLGSLILALATAQTAFASLALMLAIVLPFVVVREFARRYALARLRMGVVLALDVAAAALQVTALAVLSMWGAANAVTACAALGIACALPALAWRLTAREDLGWRVHKIRQSAARSWALGKWLILWQITAQVQSYVVYWLSIAIAGAAMTGVYAACVSIIAFANPVVFGLANVLTPKLAQAWQRGGSAGICKEAQKNALLIGALVAIFCVIVAVAGESVMHVLFPGDEYSGQGAVLTVLAFALLATSIGMPASNALASMERPRAIVVVGGLGAAATVVLTAIFMSGWGLLGAAYGYLAGCIIGATGRWVAFLAVSRREHDPSAAADNLREITGFAEDAVTVRVGGGDYAAVYSVTLPDGNTSMVKLYRDREPAMALLEFHALEKLSSMLDGRVFRGWTMRVPVPLSLSHEPLALTMRPVPGTHLQLCALEGQERLLHEAADAFAAAMQTVWSSGMKHGDFGLRNLLFDFGARTISVLDPAAEECDVCRRGSSEIGVASLDLGHLITELTTDVNDVVGSPLARLHKQVFVTAVLRAVLDDAGKGRAELMAGLRDSVAAHFQSRLGIALSPRGVWNAVVRSVAERRVAELFEDFERPAPSRRAA